MNLLLLHFFSHEELAHIVRAGKDIVSVYTLDSCIMGTETRDRRSFSRQLILCFGFGDGEGSGGVRT